MIDRRASQGALGIIGTFIGLAALGIAIFHFFLGPIETPPPLSQVVAEVASDLKEAIAAKLQGQESTSQSRAGDFGPDRLVDTLVIVMGFAALALGIVGFVRREEWRPSSAAIALGSAAIAFQFVIAIVAVILFIMLIGYVLDQLDFF